MWNQVCQLTNIHSIANQFVFFCLFRMSRQGHRYSVQDVIDAIQNGESDVDMDIDDTDEESDEEPCGVLDKENQPPTDCPADEDIEPQLATSSTPHAKHRDRYRWQKKDFTRPNTDFSGPPLTEDVTTLRTPLEYFCQELFPGLSLQVNIVSTCLLVARRTMHNLIAQTVLYT